VFALTPAGRERFYQLMMDPTSNQRDKAAVQAGLTWQINNAMIEGHVTKLKLIKRQGYGKAGFPLLRKRVLHAF